MKKETAIAIGHIIVTLNNEVLNPDKGSNEVIQQLLNVIMKYIIKKWDYFSKNIDFLNDINLYSKTKEFKIKAEEKPPEEEQKTLHNGPKKKKSEKIIKTSDFVNSEIFFTQEHIDFKNQLYEMLNDIESTDFTLKLGSFSQRVHRFMLASRSSYFSSFFESELYDLKTSESILESKIDSEKILKCLVNYIYSGKMQVDKIDIEELFALIDVSEFLGFSSHRIKNLCEQSLASIEKCLNHENFVSSLLLAEQYGLGEFKSRILNFINSHFDLLARIENLSQLSSETLAEIIISKAQIEEAKVESQKIKK